MELTRRHALAGAAGLAAAPLLPNTPCQRRCAPLADKQAPSFYRYKVGDIQVTAISDGVNTFPLATASCSTPRRTKSTRRSKRLHAEGQGHDLVRAAGNQHRRQAGCPRHRQRPGRLCVEQGRRRPVRHQHGGRGLRSQDSRYGRDLAFPWRPHQRLAQCRRHARHFPTPRCWCRRSSGSTSWTTAR